MKPIENQSKINRKAIEKRTFENVLFVHLILVVHCQQPSF